MEACRRGRTELGRLLLEAGAKDHGNRALLSSFAGSHISLAAHLLARLAFPDPEHHKLPKRPNQVGTEWETEGSRGRKLG